MGYLLHVCSQRTANPSRGLYFLPSALTAYSQIAAGRPSFIGRPVIVSLVPTGNSLGRMPARCSVLGPSRFESPRGHLAVLVFHVDEQPGMWIRELELLDHAFDGDRSSSSRTSRRMMCQRWRGCERRGMPISRPTETRRAITACLLFVVTLRERQIRNCGRAVLRLEHGVVLILAAVPVADAQVLVRIVQLHVRLLRVPRLGQRRRIVDPDVGARSSFVGLLPDLDGLDLIGVVRIAPLVDARPQLVRVDHELSPSQKPMSRRCRADSGRLRARGRVRRCRCDGCR